MVPKYFEFRGKELNLNPNPDTRFISVLVRHICRLCVSWYPVYLMAEQIIDTDITVMAAAPAPGPGHRAAHWSCTPLNLARAQLPCTSAANRSIGSTTGCTITEKAPTRAFSWLKAPTSAFTCKTLC